MKRIFSQMMLLGFAVTSLMTFGCSNTEPPATPPANPPAATGGAKAPATTGGAATPAAGATTGGASGVAATTGPDGAPLPGLAKWKDKTDPVPNNPQTLATGKELFTKNCATCHGDSGKGDGPAGLALDPKPRDFTSGQFKYGSADWQVFRTIWEGVPPPSGMAKWDGRMSETDAWTLVHYVKSLSNTK